LSRIANFFKWFTEHFPLRREELASNLRDLNGSGQSLPPILEDLNIKAWLKTWDYFIDVAHHRNTRTEKEEFRQWLQALEKQILDWFYPRTFEDFEVIDDIITEGERDA
jgi:hypothetical protein